MTDIVLRIQTAVGGAVTEVARFRKEIADTAIATSDLRETWKVTTAEIVAQTQKQIASEKEKIDQYRAEQVAIRELTSTYAKGSDERQIATKLEIDLQRKLQAALGETAVASSRAGKASARSAEERDASGFARGAGSRSGVVGAGMSALAGPGFLAGALIGGAVDMGVKAAKAEEAAQANLANALRDTGQARRVSKKALDDYVRSEEKSTGFQRDEVSQTLSQLIRSTGSLSKARQEEAVMANVARGRNTDLSGAMMLVMRAAEGNVGSLKRLGIELPKVTTYEDQLKRAHLTGNFALEKRAKALDLAATKTSVMRAVTQKFSGDSTAYMHTFGGETARLSNTWRDLEVQIGEKSIPLLTKLFAWLEKEVTALEHNKRAINDGKRALKIFETGIEDVDKVTGSFVNTLKLLAAWYVTGKVLGYANSIRKSLSSAYAAAGKAATAFRRTAEAENVAVAASSEEAGAAVDAAFPWMAIAQVAVIATIEIVTHWKQVKSWFGDFWDYMKRAGRAAWAFLVDIGKGAVYMILQYATAGIRGILEVASHIPFIGDKAKAALDDINHYIEHWKPNFKNVTAAFQQGGSAAGDAFYNAAKAGMDKAGTYVPAHRAGPRGQMVGGSVTTGGGGVQAGIVSAASSALGNPYQYGGAPSLSSPTDCSGLMVAAFAKVGIHLPRTSEEQYAQAPIKNAKPLAPGDLVFSEGIHPGHVGLYVGSGNVLEDPHTGDHVKVVPLKDFGWNGESARWWAVKAKKTPKGGGSSNPPSSAPPPGWDSAVSQAQSAASAKSKAGKGVSDPTIIGIEASITAELKDLPRHLDAVEKAAVAHIKAIKARLHVGMSQTDLAKDRAALAKWGKVLKDEIKKNADAAKKAAQQHAKEVKAAAQAAAAAWNAGWQADVSIIDRSIQEQWDKVQQTFDRETQGHVTEMQRAFQKQMDAFDRETQTGLGSFAVAQTPEEKALAFFQAQMQANQAAQQQAQLQSDLAAAIASGDPAQIKQAQQAIADQLQQDQEAALQKAADASRAAADAQTQIQQDAYQAQRDAQKQALQDQEDAAEQSYNDRRASQWQALNDQHDDQVAMFDADLALWQKALHNKSKTWAQFLKWLKNNPISAAIDGGTIDNPINYDKPSLDAGTGAGGSGTGAGTGGGACFAGDTAIAVPGGTRRIDELEVGDLVLTWDFRLRCLVKTVVTALERHEGTDMRETIAAEAGGRVLVATPEHLVYTGTEWLPFEDAPALFVPQLKAAYVVARTWPGPRVPVYNLHVDHPDHNYVAGGFLVHNVKAKAFARGGVHLRPTYGMLGEQGPEATVPLSGQAGQAAINQLARAIVQASGGGGNGTTTIYGTFLGATEKQVGRALEGLVTPAARRVVRYPAPL